VIDPAWQRLDVAARNLAPFAATVLLLLIGLVPLRLPYLPPIGTNLVLVSVYYWAMHRPTAMPGQVVLVIGLLIDLLGGGFLGVNALAMLAAYGAALGMRRWIIGASFAMVWGGYAVVAIGTMLLAWFVVLVMSGRVADIAPALSGTLFGIGAYPLLGALFAHMQRGVMR